MNTLGTLFARPAAQSLLIGCIATLFFLLLRTRDYTAVDGALRCLEVFHGRQVSFHGNNHLLYPLNVFLWHRLLAALGVVTSGPLDYLALTQGMNALAAGGSVAALYRLAHLATGSWKGALLTAGLLASSRAFLVHATSSAEPIVGLLWSLVAVLLLARSLPQPGLWSCLLSGAFFALALATYQSMALLAPAAVLLCLWRPAHTGDRPGLSTPIRRLVALAASALAIALLIYGLAYEMTGIEGVGPKVRAFFTITGARIFGQPSLRSVAVLPLGLAENVVDFVPRDAPGLRALLRSEGAPAAIALAVALVVLAALGLARLGVCWRRLDGHDRLTFASGLAGLVTTTMAPALWEPLYDKLWLQPIACLSLLAGVAAMRLPAAARRGVWLRVGAAVALVVFALNLAWALPSHRRDTPYLAQAQQLAAMTEGRDLVVHEWDRISVLYGSIWGGSRERHSFDLPTTASIHGAAARSELDRAVDAAYARGGRVYFVGILDVPRAQWRPFLGVRAGLPYELLDPYRAGSRAVASLPFDASRIRLFLWKGPAPRRAPS